MKEQEIKHSIQKEDLKSAIIANNNELNENIDKLQSHVEKNIDTVKSIVSSDDIPSN